MSTRPTDLEIAQAICCGDECRTDTTHCHAGDHFSEAYRVRKLLDRCADPAAAPPSERKVPAGARRRARENEGRRRK